MNLSRTAVRVAGWLVAGAWAAGCMFLVDDELGTVRCSEEGALGPPACPDAQICRGGLCSAPVPRPDLLPLGASCSRDTDCAPGDFCIDASAFGAEGPRTCSRTCCTSGECDYAEATTGPEDAAPPSQDFVCWGSSEGGGSFCRRAEPLGRGALGLAKAGDLCEAGIDCRSGLCQAGLCTDGCCSDENCAGAGARCRLQDYGADGSMWACGPALYATKGLLEACRTDQECISGLCLLIGGTQVCSQPCCDSSSCGLIQKGSTSGKLACADIERNSSRLRACARVLPDTATLAVGNPCSKDAQCRSGICLPEPSDGGLVCTDVCCVDSDCGDPSLACRPRKIEATWALRCELK